MDNPRVLGTTNRDIRPVRSITPTAPALKKYFCQITTALTLHPAMVSRHDPRFSHYPFKPQGDCLIAINGTSVAGWTVEEAEEYINGLEDPVEVTTTCLSTNVQLSTHDLLQVTGDDSEDLAAVREDIR